MVFVFKDLREIEKIVVSRSPTVMFYLPLQDIRSIARWCLISSHICELLHVFFFLV